jgi:hypothetical protein
MYVRVIDQSTANIFIKPGIKNDVLHFHQQRKLNIFVLKKKIVGVYGGRGFKQSTEFQLPCFVIN